MVELPSGTVTFLFTDIEGSTRLWEERPEAMPACLARHDEILRAAIEAHQGYVVKTMGDGVLAAFATAAEGVAAAVDAQRAITSGSWEAIGGLRVRMGLHTGAAEVRDGDYFGSALSRAARLMSVAHGDQVIVSQVTKDLAGDSLPPEVDLVDLGEHRLRDLASPMRVFQVVHPELPAEFPALRSLDAFPSNLPLQLTTFVGREHELTEVATALDSARVVTLTGIGGVGKTRVALQAAARVLAQYRDGAWFCELAPIGDPAAVAEAIATALGVATRQGQTTEDSLVDFLRVKQLLLVLDNCEHLLDSVTDVVDRVVRTCPRITVLATSREGLALAGERIVALGSMGVPGLDAGRDAVGGADAVRLFVERAAEARTGFVMHDDNQAAVVQICRRLDGIPLAIELAAARVQAMTPGEIATRLDDQFRLLRGGPRGAVERHQTLRRTIDWSYDLLTDDERLVLDRLSVFAGSCTLDDAEAVVGADVENFDVLEHLGALVRRSLVLADEEDGHTRYRLLETVRQYAHEHLEQSGSAQAMQHRHAVYYAALAGQAGPYLRGADQLAWIARLMPEIDNLRAAQGWAIDHDDLDLALTVIVPLCVDSTPIGYRALEWANALATNAGVDTRPLGPALLAQAAVHAALAVDFERATALDTRRCEAEAALGLAPRSANFQAPALIALLSGSPDALDRARRWVEFARAAGDRYEAVHALTLLGSVIGFTDPAAAVSAMHEAVAEARRLANPSTLSWSITLLALHQVAIDPTQSLPLLEDAIRVGSTVGNRQAVALAYGALAEVYSGLGDQRATLRTYLRAIDLDLAVGNGQSLVASFVRIAATLAACGEDEAAGLLQGAADSIYLPPMRTLAEVRAMTLAALRERLGDDRLTELLARGATMAADEGVAYARTKLEAIEARWPTND